MAFLAPLTVVALALAMSATMASAGPPDGADPAATGGEGGRLRAQLEQTPSIGRSTLVSPGVVREIEKGTDPSIDAVSEPGAVLVEFASGTDEQTIGRMASSAESFWLDGITRVNAPGAASFALFKSDTLSTAALVDHFQDMSGVLAVSPNYLRHADVIPSDPRFGELWGLNNTGQTGGTADADIDAVEAWDSTTGSAAVVVADLDTGVDYNHEDLVANMWTNPGEIAGDSVDNDGNGYVDDVYGIDRAEYDTDPMDEDGHGTHTSGTIAAVGNNGIGVTGVAWNTKIMALRFLGAGGGYDSDAVTCINYAIDMKLNHGVNVVAINASWGSAAYDTVLRDAIAAAGTAGIVFCASAGNTSEDTDVTPHYPSGYDCSSIISVAATDSFDNLASFSSYGATSIDIGAPGVEILSTYIDGSSYTPAPGDLFYDDMDSGSGNWTAEAPWALNSEAYFTPYYSWSDSPSSNYSDNADTSLTSRAIDLSSASSDTSLAFLLTYDLEDGYDQLFVEASGNNGSSWESLGWVTGHGGAGSWYIFVASLPTSLLTDQFRLRFRLVTDSSVVYDGVHIDLVGIGVPGDPYQAINGTSMATPHVTGAVALVAAVSPADSMATRIDRILSSADPVASLSGKCVTGGRLNAAAAVGGIPTPNVTTPSTAGPFTQGSVVPVAWNVAAPASTGWFHVYAYKDGTYYWLNSQAASGAELLQLQLDRDPTHRHRLRGPGLVRGRQRQLAGLRRFQPHLRHHHRHPPRAHRHRCPYRRPLHPGELGLCRLERLLRRYHAATSTPTPTRTAPTTGWIAGRRLGRVPTASTGP